MELMVTWARHVMCLCRILLLNNMSTPTVYDNVYVAGILVPAAVETSLQELVTPCECVETYIDNTLLFIMQHQLFC